MEPFGVSYLRFSEPSQAEGDSTRRQNQGPEAWCQRNNVRLDKSLKFSFDDKGKTAYNRETLHGYALAELIAKVQSGDIPKGSYIIFENLDRLSREFPVLAFHRFTGLLLEGVNIVQLEPEKVYRKEADLGDMIGALLELARGHSESKAKSFRVGQSWQNKHAEAATKVVTRKVPGWITYDEKTKTLDLDEKKAAVVRRMFNMALAGDGVATIAKKLNADRVEVLGRTKLAIRGQHDVLKDFKKTRPVVWNETTVYHILKSTATYGEYVPHKGRGTKRTPLPAVPNYYKACITKEIYEAVAGVLSARKGKKAGRRGKHINLFSTLLFDARDGGTFTYRNVNGRPSTILPVGAKQGTGAKWSCFRAVTFEAAVLGELREVTAEDVQGGESDAAKNVTILAGRLAYVEGEIKFWTDSLGEPDGADLPAAVRQKLIGWERTRRVLVKEVADARREVANPLTEAWSEARGLISLLEKDESDEMREKVRSALRRCIESIYCLFTGIGRLRIAAVRVQFKGTDRHRTYYIGYEPGRSNHHVKREGRYEVFTDTYHAAPNVPQFDLRQPVEADAAERWLHGLADEINTPCENDPSDTVGLVAAIIGAGTRLVSVSRSATRSGSPGDAGKHFVRGPHSGDVPCSDPGTDNGPE